MRQTLPSSKKQPLIKEPDWLSTLLLSFQSAFMKILGNIFPANHSIARCMFFVNWLDHYAWQSICEKSPFRASYLMPMFLTVEQGSENWCNLTEEILDFMLYGQHHWNGHREIQQYCEGQGNAVGLKSDQSPVVAWILWSFYITSSCQSSSELALYMLQCVLTMWRWGTHTSWDWVELSHW